MNYSEQLQTKEWENKSLLVMLRDNFTCYMCGYHGNRLNVHHKEYLPYLMAWEYPDELLITLCFGCHKTAHKGLIISKRIEKTKIHNIINKIRHG